MLEKILYEIDNLTPNMRDYFKHMFQPSSYTFLKAAKIVTIKANERFIYTGDRVHNVWVCITGTVKVMEEFKSGETYIFTQFSAPAIYGEMEILAGIPLYRSSLVAATNCLFIVGPATAYINWLQKDSNALFERTQFIAKRLMEEGRSNRSYLLLDGTERIKIYLIDHYTCNPDEPVCIIKNTRQQISDETGYSVKTISRAIKKLREQKLLTVEGQRIIISNQQYKKMLESIDEKANITNNNK